MPIQADSAEMIPAHFRRIYSTDFILVMDIIPNMLKTTTTNNSYYYYYFFPFAIFISM